MAGRAKEGAKWLAMIVSALIIMALVGALVVMFRNAHTGG